MRPTSSNGAVLVLLMLNDNVTNVPAMAGDEDANPIDFAPGSDVNSIRQINTFFKSLSEKSNIFTAMISAIAVEKKTLSGRLSARWSSC